MNKSSLLQKNHDELVALNKKMTPKERLVAFFNHSQLVSRLFEAGAKFRSQTLSAAPKKSSKPS